VFVSGYASGPVGEFEKSNKSTHKAEYKEAADFFTTQRKFCLLAGRHPYKSLMVPGTPMRRHTAGFTPLSSTRN
jgi:hypothetical protein